MTAKLGICSLIAAAALLAVPLRADAGGPWTANEIVINLKAVDEAAQNFAGDVRPERHAGKTTDVFSLCTTGAVGTAPTKTEGIYLFSNCDDHSLDTNEIDAVDTSTSPPTLLAVVGSIAFDAPQVATTKLRVRKAAKVKATITINCSGGAISAVLHGVVNLKFSPQAPQNSCIDSGKAKVLGTGTSNAANVASEFILDDGSSISLKKRSAAITSLPVH